MFCFCWQNSFLKLQALETDLCSAFLTHQGEATQVHGVKDPALVATQSSPAGGADATGKRLGWAREVLSCALRILLPLAAISKTWSPMGNCLVQ